MVMMTLVMMTMTMVTTKIIWIIAYCWWELLLWFTTAVFKNDRLFFLTIHFLQYNSDVDDVTDFALRFKFPSQSGWSCCCQWSWKFCIRLQQWWYWWSTKKIATPDDIKDNDYDDYDGNCNNNFRVILLPLPLMIMIDNGVMMIMIKMIVMMMMKFPRVVLLLPTLRWRGEKWPDLATRSSPSSSVTSASASASVTSSSITNHHHPSSSSRRYLRSWLWMFTTRWTEGRRTLCGTRLRSFLFTPFFCHGLRIYNIWKLRVEQDWGHFSPQYYYPTSSSSYPTLFPHDDRQHQHCSHVFIILI